MLDARRLRILCEVVKHGSFSGAAESLGYTQPAISRQVATLEAEVGTTLVRRLPRGIALTDAGRLLVDRATTILAQMEGVELELQELLGLRGGRIRIGAFASSASSIVPLAVLRFRESHPEVELSVVVGDPVDTMPRLAAGELDLVVCHDPEGWTWHESPPGFEFLHLLDDPMYAVLPADHPLADATPLDLAQLANESWMLSGVNTCPDWRLVHGACVKAGFEPRITLENDDYPAVLGLVAAGMGVALIPELVTRVVHQDVVVRELDPPPPDREIMAVLPLDYSSPATRAFAAVLQDVAAEWVRAREAPSAVVVA